MPALASMVRVVNIPRHESHYRSAPQLGRLCHLQVAAIRGMGEIPLKFIHLDNVEMVNEAFNPRRHKAAFWLTLLMEKFLLETWICRGNHLTFITSSVLGFLLLCRDTITTITLIKGNLSLRQPRVV